MIKTETMSDKNSTNTNVFINFLPKDFTKKELEMLCSRFGQISSAKVMIDLITGESKCYGFVRFTSHISAVSCIRSLNEMPIGSKKLAARWASSMENVGAKSASILVKSLPLDYDNQKIWQDFHHFGTILGIELVISEKTGLPKGSAYVTFSSIQEAKLALENMNNVKINTDSWPLFIRYTDKIAIGKAPILGGITVEKPQKKLSEKSADIVGSTNSYDSNSSSPVPSPPHTQSSSSPSQQPIESKNQRTSSPVSSQQNYSDDTDSFYYKQLLEDLQNEDDK